MADEQETQEIVEAEPQQEQETQGNWRQSPGAIAMAKQISELQKKLERKEKADADAIAQRERQELESKGEYETILRSKDAELENLRKEFESKMVSKELDLELTKAGFSNKLLLKGAKAGYDGSVDIPDYVAGLLADESVKALLSPQEPPVPSSKFHKPAGKSSAKTLEERIEEGDTEAQKEYLGTLLGVAFK